MTIPIAPSFSRSGRSGPGGKHTYSVAHAPNLGNAQNETEAGPDSEPKEGAK